jgi:hypothetical protein
MAQYTFHVLLMLNISFIFCPTPRLEAPENSLERPYKVVSS